MKFQLRDLHFSKLTRRGECTASSHAFAIAVLVASVVDGGIASGVVVVVIVIALDNRCLMFL